MKPMKCVGAAGEIFEREQIHRILQTNFNILRFALYSFVKQTTGLREMA